MILRDYQQRTLDELYAWWMRSEGTPLVTVPTAGGKSIIIAELCRLLFDTWPEEHPRTVVIVPSKELAEQNGEKLVSLVPSHIRVGFYSASLGRKRPDADVIVATIGSIYKAAHVLGNIKCVVIDEAHLVNPDGAEAGRYRQFLTDLAKYCQFRIVGYTATPFRGNGIWLTEGDKPLFHGVASHVTVKELLDKGYISPLIRPMDAVKTRIDTDGIKTTSGDYNIGELSVRVESYLPAAAEEACILAADRKKWIAFCATVQNAHHFAHELRKRGISAQVVTGDTPKAERAERIAEFRAGLTRCLITVLALATGFDVPDVDCILWLRPTQSPVLYVQGAGRGFRIAPGKTDCLWLDFSDTTERLGPVDTIKGRKKPKKSEKQAGAPSKTCDECGEQVPAALPVCPTCGFEFPVKVQEARSASNAAIMSMQAEPKVVTYPVDKVTYRIHRKEGKPDSIRVDYWEGFKVVASEWVCPLHGGFATGKAQRWIDERTSDRDYRYFLCSPEENAIHDVKDSSSGIWELQDWIDQFSEELLTPTAIQVNTTGKFHEIVKHIWTPHEPADPNHGHPGDQATAGQLRERDSQVRQLRDVSGDLFGSSGYAA
jgi:DNA repair protein RadD